MKVLQTSAPYVAFSRSSRTYENRRLDAQKFAIKLPEAEIDPQNPEFAEGNWRRGIAFVRPSRFRS